MGDTHTRLAGVLEARKHAAPDSSSVASLHHTGLNKILEKLGEESVETIIAAKDAALSHDCGDVIYETADLWFHSMIMLAALGQHPQAVPDELDRRFGLSGYPEIASRTQGQARPPFHNLKRIADLWILHWKHCIASQSALVSPLALPTLKQLGHYIG